MTDDKRLIEDYLPIQAISKEASREKSVRKGNISTLHLWWARRPLVACRAAVYGALVPASRFAWSNESKKGKKRSGKDLGRAEAEKFVEKLCKYPGDARVIAEAQQHILEAHAERLSEEQGKEITARDIIEGRAPRPKVLDMFAGGGAIPLEALRLGCEAYALELNPVAHIIELCTLVYPQKYGKPDPNARGMTGPKNAEGKTTWGGLVEELRYWGNVVLDQLRKEIGDLYPLIPDPKGKKRDLVPVANARLFEDATQHKLKLAEDYLTPVAYLWTRAVTCKNRTCRGKVPLVKQTWLCKKKSRYVAMKMVALKREKEVHFSVVESTSEKGLGFDPEGFSKGGNATCPFCGTVSDVDYVKKEGCAGRMSHLLMAVACTRPKRSGKGKQPARGKVYISASDLKGFIPNEALLQSRVDALCKRTGLTVPSEPIINDAKSALFCVLYGLNTFGALFTRRQILCLMTLVAIVRDVSKQIHKSGCDSGTAKAIATFLAVIIDRLADFNSTLCVFNYTGGRGVKNTFGRQSLPMVWDFAETNPFNPAGASWVSGIEDVPAGLRDTDVSRGGTVKRGSATELPWPDGSFDAVITDPPYYDNVPYADISDFFYVWLKRAVGDLYPEHLSAEGTPKKKEAVADATRHGGDRAKANLAYQQMMAQSFGEANRVLKPGGQMTVVYAHKTTLGWATLVDALRHAGFIVTEAWPLDTEKLGRLRAQEAAALASSIFLVARKREEDARSGSYEDEVQPQLEQIVRERVDTLWKMGISGADLVIAAVGAGLRAFTQFARVEYANGEEVPSERFLAEVEGVVLETMLEKIFGVSRSGVAAVDGPSRFYVLWRYTYKAAELDAGEAIVFTYGQPVELDGQGGLSTGGRALVAKKASKYRLYDFTERGDNDKLGLRNEDGEAATLIDVLHRVLWVMENKPRSLAGFLDEARPDRERLRLVAQALAGPGLKGKSDGDSTTLLATTTGEQAALGKLLANWRTLIDSRLEEFSLR